jgi:hypothetical protein
LAFTFWSTSLSDESDDEELPELLLDDSELEAAVLSPASFVVGDDLLDIIIYI